eukprot:SAG25_NODE_1322_length_3291_cov_7.635652_4_plen_185_part_00
MLCAFVGARFDNPKKRLQSSHLYTTSHRSSSCPLLAMRRSVVKGLSRIFDLSSTTVLSQRRFSNHSKILSARFSPIIRQLRIQQENFHRIERGNQFTFCRFGPAEEKFFPQQIVDSVLFHNLSGQIDSSMHRLRSAAESGNLLIENSQVQLKNVNRLNSNSILSQPAASQPASQHASEEIAKMR